MESRYLAPYLGRIDQPQYDLIKSFIDNQGPLNTASRYSRTSPYNKFQRFLKKKLLEITQTIAAPEDYDPRNPLNGNDELQRSFTRYQITLGDTLGREIVKREDPPEVEARFVHRNDLIQAVMDKRNTHPNLYVWVDKFGFTIKQTGDVEYKLPADLKVAVGEKITPVTGYDYNVNFSRTDHTARVNGLRNTWRVDQSRRVVRVALADVMGVPEDQIELPPADRIKMKLVVCNRLRETPNKTQYDGPPILGEFTSVRDFAIYLLKMRPTPENWQGDFKEIRP